MTKTIFTGTYGRDQPYTTLRKEQERSNPTEILILAALALAISVTCAIVALKLLVFLVSLPLKLLGATAGAAFELAATLGVLFVIAAVIAFVLVLLPVAAIGALAIALVS